MIKRAAVVGYGKSGVGAEKILRNQGFDVDIYDDKYFMPGTNIYKLDELAMSDYLIISPTPGIDPAKIAVTLIEKEIRENGYGIIKETDYIKLNSSGFNQRQYYGFACKMLEDAGLYIVGEVELAYGVMPQDCKIIAVSGTNGKSTVVHLVGQILNSAGIKAVCCGNYGVAFSEAVLSCSKDMIYVVELSSFQLELLKEFSANAAAIVNITSDHMDRYPDFDSYAQTKARLAEFVAPGGIFICEPHPVVVNKTIRMNHKVMFMDESLSAWPKLKNGNILDFGGFYADISDFKLPGIHNIINLAFALSLAGYTAGFEGDVSGFIKNLKGMPHRLETVSRARGAVWINDSKATNVVSTKTALACFDGDVTVLLGGRDKEGGYAELAGDLNRCAKRICLFGEAAGLIARELEGKTHVKVEIFSGLENVIETLADSCGENDIILLSPACPSFDEFINFENRGEMFCRFIEKYTGVKRD